MLFIACRPARRTRGAYTGDGILWRIAPRQIEKSMNLMSASNQWATRPADQRFETLEALWQSVADRRGRSRSVDVDLSRVKAARVEIPETSKSTIVLNSGLSAVEPNHWSFGQVSGWIGAPAAYLRTLPTGLAVDCINNGIERSASERGSLKFMTVTSPDGEGLNTLQACTSTTYGRIWDADCVSSVQRVVERSGGKFFNPKAYDIATGAAKPSGLYASDRDVFMFMIDGGSLLDAGPRAQLNRGFIVTNSEVGARTFSLTTFFFNTVCGNHIIWGARDVREMRIRHTQNGPARFDQDATPSLIAYCTRSAGPEIDVIKRAQDKLLIATEAWNTMKPSEAETALVDWFKARKFNGAEAREAIALARKEEGDCRTVWQAVQGITAYARGFDFVDSRIDLETRAGKLLETV
jgi:hypothetical protein